MLIRSQANKDSEIGYFDALSGSPFFLFLVKDSNKYKDLSKLLLVVFKVSPYLLLEREVGTKEVCI